MTARFVPFQARHGSHPIPSIGPVVRRIADVTDALAFPNITEAIAAVRANPERFAALQAEWENDNAG
jgi:hypothetical protein